MNKRFIIFLAGASAMVLLLTSCKQKGGSGPAYSLKMRLNKGDKFGQGMDMSMKMNFSLISCSHVDGD